MKCLRIENYCTSFLFKICREFVEYKKKKYNPSYFWQIEVFVCSARAKYPVILTPTKLSALSQQWFSILLRLKDKDISQCIYGWVCAVESIYDRAYMAWVGFGCDVVMPHHGLKYYFFLLFLFFLCYNGLLLSEQYSILILSLYP